MRKVPKVLTNSLNNSINLSYKKQNCSLIWLHGLGDTSQGFMSFFTHSSSPLYEGVRIKLIQAPLRNVTINGGEKCPSWYDIRSLKRFTQDENKVFNFEQMQQSRKNIQEHVQEEVKFWQNEQKNSQINPYHRIYIGGFSQGGVMALNYGLQAKNIPAGVITLSGYLLKSTPLTNYKKFPICIMHGQNDQVIKQVEAKHSYQPILGESPFIQYHCLKKLGHTVRLQQLGMFKNWFKQSNQMISRHYQKK